MYNAQMLIDKQASSVLSTDMLTCLSGRAGKNLSARRCLVVDDDPIILRLVAEMLTELGFEVATAENGMRALGKIVTYGYDLVMTDLEMPVMNGFTLAARAKGHADGTKIVIMTGRCHAEVFSMMDRSVVDAWLFKPFGWTELCQTLGGLKLCNTMRTAVGS